MSITFRQRTAESIEWLGKVLPWVFSILGIAATVYFSVFYYPDYLKEMREERTKAVNRELIELVQERIYNRIAVDSTVLSNLVEGKEIRYNVEYPYSYDQLLIQARDGFVSSKYLPLELRDSLTSIIDSLVTALRSIPSGTRDTTRTALISSFIPSFNWLPILSGLVGLVLALWGIIGLATKARQEKAREVEESVDERKDEIERQVTDGLRYEQRVKEVLEDLGINLVDTVTSVGGFRTDFSVAIHNRIYLVSCKLLTRGYISTGFFENLGRVSANFNEPAILVTNSRLTKANIEWLHDFDHRGDLAKVHVVRGNSASELKEAFKQFLVNQSPPSET